MTLFDCLLIDYVIWNLFVCLCILSYKLFSLLLLINLFILMCQKSKNHIKSRKSKVWLTLLSFVLKLVLPCTFVLMALCIYERSLFPCTYHCGKNLKIYVIVVNRSSNLSWMISEWFCWSWDMHKLVPTYLPTLYFFCFY